MPGWTVEQKQADGTWLPLRLDGEHLGEGRYGTFDFGGTVGDGSGGGGGDGGDGGGGDGGGGGGGGTSLFAGHTPGRVMFGIAAPEGPTGSLPRPVYTDAVAILKGSPGERNYHSGWRLSESRRFSQSNISLSSLEGFLDDCATRRVFGVLSWKYGVDSWARFADGDFDADLDIIGDKVDAMRRAGSTQKFSWGLVHEPDGNGNRATEVENLADLRNHAIMTRYILLYNAGYRRNGAGVMTAGLGPDNRDVCTVHVIWNGHWWSMRHNLSQPLSGTKYQAHPDRVAAAAPDSLVELLGLMGGLTGADFYDPDPPFSSTTQRTWLKMEAFTLWARSRKARALFCGEFCVADEQIEKCWEYVRAQRNGDADGYGVWVILNLFDSIANSRQIWYCVPADFAGSSYVTDKGLPDTGGTPTTEERMYRVREVAWEALLSTYGGPVPA